MAKRAFRRTSTTSDQQGNITQHSEFFVERIKGEEDFVKMYLMDLAQLKSLTPREFSVLNELLPRMGYDNQVGLSAGVKKEICRCLGMYQYEGRGRNQTIRVGGDGEIMFSMNGLTMEIRGLCDKQILFKKAMGLYIVNPYLFGKGRWQDIATIRMTVNYTPQGREEETKVQKKSE
jgi:hypothetical protein